MWQWIRSNASNDDNLAVWGCADLQHNNDTIIPKSMSEQRSLRHSSLQTTVQSRRRLKSSLYFAFALIAATFYSTNTTTVVNAFSAANHPSGLSQRKQQWIERSVAYYSSVMRNKGVGNTKSLQTPRQHEPPVASNILDDGATSLVTNQQQQLNEGVDSVVDKDFIGLATKHYYARVLIKMGKWECAERLYRRIIEELTYDESEEAGGEVNTNCDHTKLAVSTLLLALHMQRIGDVRATRSVFLRFFRRVAFLEQNEDEEEGGHKCACSAKVLQAYALFEMKNGTPKKSLEIIRRAVQMDEGLRSVLSWKQFRDVAARRAYSPTFTFRKTTWEHQLRLRQQIMMQQQEEKSSGRQSTTEL